MNKKYIWVLIIALLLIIGFSIAKNDHKQTNPTIKIGALLSLTGEAATWGENAQNAIQLATEEANAAGGIHGKKLRWYMLTLQEIPKSSFCISTRHSS